MVTAFKLTSNRMAISTDQAKEWVKLHYEKNEDGVVAKSVMYKHYQDECKISQRPLMETSIFGRIVKSIFPDVNIRRLGGRDNLKYYYCGIQVKPDSKYFADNATTTRPKRRLRKRELVTTKADVHVCIKWLHANYQLSDNSMMKNNSVVKKDVYESYKKHCAMSSSEPLSTQYFGMVINHAFPKLTKRKLGPRSNQQKYYYGIQPLPNPLPLESIPNDAVISAVDSIWTNGKLDYRENLDEESEEQFCHSPISETSESPHGLESHYEEPDLHTFSNIHLEDEHLDHDQIKMENEPLDLSNMGYRSIERDIPERPTSHITYGCISPSPPVKEPRAGKIYKPKFHYDYHEDSLDNETEVKCEKNDFSDNKGLIHLKSWILSTFEGSSEHDYVIKDQVFMDYKEECKRTNTIPLPERELDLAMKEIFVSTFMYEDKVNYFGVRFKYNQQMIGESSYYSNFHDNDMDLSPPNDYSSNCSHIDSPAQLEDEEDDEPPDEGPLPLNYSCKNDLVNIPEVLRDGKYYLKMWLTDNFESVPNSCVLKSDAYKHYDYYAKVKGQTPFEMNVFGKIVRQVFPQVTIRRLGGREKAQYHYCGIGIKRTSQLFHLMSGKDPAQRSRKKEIATDNRSAEIVIDWLKRYYRSDKSKVITKNEVFKQYTEFCEKINEPPARVHYFGKLVKHCFPDVEVRKFGGRREPTWCYHGLVPKTAELESSGAISFSYNNSPDRNVISYGMQLSQSMPSSFSPITREELDSYRSNQHRSNSIPINDNMMNPSRTVGGSSVIVGFSPSPLAAHNDSPFHRNTPLNYHGYMDSSIDSKSSFTDFSRSPAEGGGLKEVSRRFVTNSPYESADIAPENIYPRSPGDMAAQISRSPGSILYSRSTCPNSLETTSSHYSNPVLLSQSPVERIAHNRIPSSISNGGCQVVPSQTPPGVNPSILERRPGVHSAVLQPPRIKRYKGQQQMRDEYENLKI